MVTAVGTVTPLVVTANVFVVAPAATVTERRHRRRIGVAARQRHHRTARRRRAGECHCAGAPALPVTAVGLTLTPSRAAGPAGFTVSVAVLTTPL